MVSILSRSWSAVRRVIGYIRSDDDLVAVYGEHPNGPRDETNVAGALTINAAGGMR